MMLKPSLSAIPLLLLAKTVWADCTTRSYTTCEDRIVHRFDPTNGEVCDPLDCGGGRAPPKTDVPGCPAYKGTEVYVSTRSTLSCWTPSTSLASTSATLTYSSPTTDAVSVKETENSIASSTASGASSTQQSAGNTGAPATTKPPTRPTSADNAGDASNTSGDGAQATTTDTNAGSLMEGSLMAVAGAVVGIIALV